MISDLSYTPAVNEIESYQMNKNSLCYGNIEKEDGKSENKKEKKDKNEEEEKKDKKDKTICWEKIKKLSVKMHTNEIKNQKSSCFWCTESFLNNQICIPKKTRGEKI